MTGTDSNRVKIGFASLGVLVLCLMGWIVNLQLQMTKIQTVSERAARDSQESLDLHSRSKRAEANAPDKKSYYEPGVVFVRWGRSECPNTGTELVYEGIMGGKYYAHHGSGNNYLCMPRKPEWLRTKAGVQRGASLYGVEYQTGYGKREDLLFQKPAFNLQDHDAVCSVCRSYRASTQVMIPGKVNCDEGWTREYFGYLMAPFQTHAGAKDFICVDHAPEADASGHKRLNGAHLHFVEAICGSLPCPSYIQGAEITCVVCSK